MFCGRLAGAAAFSRAPRGARGLKSSSQAALTIYIGRAPRGARGLKLRNIATFTEDDGRAPRGARGLKYVKHAVWVCFDVVVPLAGHVD